MRRSLLALLLILGTTAAVVVSSSLPHGYAQAAGPVGDEFNNNVFAAPFKAQCAPQAFPTACPDAQSATTWDLNASSPGNLRIWTQPGTLLQAANTARNLILQPYSPSIDWTATTKLTFPATTSPPRLLGQTAGLIVYQDADNFIYVARILNSTGTGAATSTLQFLQESGGADIASSVAETGVVPSTIYLQVKKSGNAYQAFYSYDNVTFTAIAPGSPATATPLPTNTPVGTATSVPVATSTSVPAPTAYVTGSNWTSPQVGLFAYGGTDPQVGSNLIPADFDWFRVGNQLTPAPTAQPTSTGTVSATNTPVPATSTSTAVPATSTPTAAPTNTPTNTPVPPTPTPTPKPKPTVVKAQFQYISIWWHAVREGTYQHVQVQAKNHSIHGIWALVYLPSGQHYYYYENTDASGLWVKEFPIPRNAISRYSHDAVITFQLWKGKSTVKNFGSFILVR